MNEERCYEGRILREGGSPRSEKALLISEGETKDDQAIGEGWRACGKCRYFNIDTCMYPKNKRDGIRPEVDVDHSCRLFKVGKWEVKAKENREIDPRLRTCGNCKRRKEGYCVSIPSVIGHGSVIKPYALAKSKEFVDKEETACVIFDPIAHPKLTYQPWVPVNTRQLVRVVRCCGECAFFLNGLCLSAKVRAQLMERPKVGPFTPACEFRRLVLDE